MKGKRHQKLKWIDHDLLISLSEFSLKNMPSRSRRGSDNKQEFTISDGVMTELEGKSLDLYSKNVIVKKLFYKQKFRETIA